MKAAFDDASMKASRHCDLVSRRYTRADDHVGPLAQRLLESLYLVERRRTVRVCEKNLLTDGCRDAHTDCVSLSAILRQANQAKLGEIRRHP